MNVIIRDKLYDLVEKSDKPEIMETFHFLRYNGDRKLIRFRICALSQDNLQKLEDIANATFATDLSGNIESYTSHPFDESDEYAKHGGKQRWRAVAKFFEASSRFVMRAMREYSLGNVKMADPCDDYSSYSHYLYNQLGCSYLQEAENHLKEAFFYLEEHIKKEAGNDINLRNNLLSSLNKIQRDTFSKIKNLV
ncbi:MAG: hypothetical protein KAV25_04850 [Methanophagales archaeon]|nr:hypothetical protein [Methanophagales archaeon]